MDYVTHVVAIGGVTLLANSLAVKLVLSRLAKQKLTASPARGF